MSVHAQLLGPVRLFATPWTVAHWAPLSMQFSRQEHWSGLPFPFPGDLPDPRIEPESPALAGRFFTTAPPGKPAITTQFNNSLPEKTPSKGWKQNSTSTPTCTLIAALLTTAERWKQPNCPLTGEWMTKLGTRIRWPIGHTWEWSANPRYNVGESWIYYAEWNKPDIKGHVLYDAIYMKYPEEANPQRQKAD